MQRNAGKSLLLVFLLFPITLGTLWALSQFVSIIDMLVEQPLVILVGVGLFIFVILRIWKGSIESDGEVWLGDDDVTFVVDGKVRRRLRPTPDVVSPVSIYMRTRYRDVHLGPGLEIVDENFKPVYIVFSAPQLDWEQETPRHPGPVHWGVSLETGAALLAWLHDRGTPAGRFSELLDN